MKLWMAPAGLHIEPARPDDAAAIARIHAGAFFMGWPQSEFAAYASDQETTPIFVACDAKRRIAGFAVFRVGGDEAELLSIAVDPKWRGKGVGVALLQAAIADFTYSPVRRLFLEVDEANVPALRLYRRFGFAEVGKRPAYYRLKSGATATALVMRADLG